MNVIIWDGTPYLEIAPTVPKRRFGANFEDYTAEPRNAASP